MMMMLKQWWVTQKETPRCLFGSNFGSPSDPLLHRGASFLRLEKKKMTKVACIKVNCMLNELSSQPEPTSCRLGGACLSVTTTLLLSTLNSLFWSIPFHFSTAFWWGGEWITFDCTCHGFWRPSIPSPGLLLTSKRPAYCWVCTITSIWWISTCNSHAPAKEEDCEGALPVFRKVAKINRGGYGGEFAHRSSQKAKEKASKDSNELSLFHIPFPWRCPSCPLRVSDISLTTEESSQRDGRWLVDVTSTDESLLHAICVDCSYTWHGNMIA